MKCPNCENDNPPAAKFCANCGGPLGLACPACAHGNPPGSRFCNECGRSLGSALAASLTSEPPGPRAYTPRHIAERILTSASALEGERKQVSVLFCDLVGSTALAARLGPEAMHALLNRFFELALEEVHRYEGTINQFLGDGFMALFGAPIAHEDHARRAALAAIGIRRRLLERQADLGLPEGAPLPVRMGLHTGPVVVGRIGDDLRMDYTAVGDTPNLAARLQQVAEPGAILMSEATRQLTTSYIRVEDVGPLHLKGRDEPVAAYRIAGRSALRSPVEIGIERPASPFVGRERELADLRDLLEQVERGQGQIVGLVGEPGLGKSRLLFEFRRSLADGRVTYLEGRCLSYGQAISYLPVIEILRGNCAIAEADGPAEILEKLRFSLQELGMDPDEGTAYLLALLGVKEGTEPLASLSAEAIRTRTFETIRQMTLRGSRRRPLVLAIEDLHWIILGFNYYHIGDFERALASEARCREIGQALGDPRLQSYADWVSAQILAAMGQPDAAIDLARRAVGLSPDALGTAAALNTMGWCYIEKGEPAHAIPNLERAVRALAEFGFRQLHGMATAWLGQACLADGQVERAYELASQALEIARVPLFPHAVGFAQRLLGKIAYQRGSLEEADARLRETLATFGGSDARFEVARTLLDLTALAQAQNDREAAIGHLREARVLFEALRVPTYVERTEALARAYGVPFSSG